MKVKQPSRGSAGDDDERPFRHPHPGARLRADFGADGSIDADVTQRDHVVLTPQA